MMIARICVTVHARTVLLSAVWYARASCHPARFTCGDPGTSAHMPCLQPSPLRATRTHASPKPTLQSRLPRSLSSAEPTPSLQSASTCQSARFSQSTATRAQLPNNEKSYRVCSRKERNLIPEHAYICPHLEAVLQQQGPLDRCVRKSVRHTGTRGLRPYGRGGRQLQVRALALRVGRGVGAGGGQVVLLAGEDGDKDVRGLDDG